jgi:tRNA1Val (adenine37-N6)-methyltransferase
MENPTFRFKQFNITDAKCGMKLGTDGVLLGAWTSVDDVHSIMDVGAGCGIISLMLAQRCDASILAVEIDKNASEDCQTNFSESPWASRLTVTNADFNGITSPVNSEGFDLIVSNPPFFNNGITAPSKSRAQARHEQTLTIESLIQGASKLLSANGRLALITPADRCDDIIFFAEINRLKLCRRCDVIPVINKMPKRILWEFSFRNQRPIMEQLVIRVEDNAFSDKYVELMSDFYLKM